MVSPGRTVLLAEDDDAMRSILVEVLEDDGYRVHAVADGAGLMERLRQEPVDVIITDVHMPGIDGLELLATLRTLGLGTAVILISGFAEIELKTAQRLGAQAVLSKPFALSALRRALESVGA